MEKILITGATGWLGRHLLEYLKVRKADVLALIRPATQSREAALLQSWVHGFASVGGRFEVQSADLSAPGLGLEQPLDATQLQHVFHLAALYDLGATQEQLWPCNVEGTRGLLEYLRQGGFQGTFHHLSSIAVAGDAQGDFKEADLDVGQAHPHPYHRSKFEAEKLVRAEGSLRYRIYRPSAIVGHSKTGEMGKIDGPYYLFKPLRLLRDALPRWFPLYSNRRLELNMLPVDVVAQIIDGLAFAPGLDGKTFHVVDPAPPRFFESYNLLADAAGAPRIRGRGLMRYLPMGWAQELGSMRFFRDEIFKDLDIPPGLLAAINDRVRYDTEDIDAALEGMGIHRPPQSEYVQRLWDYWLRHLDPDRDPDHKRRACFRGKIVLITGASSGIGATLADRCAALGATVLIAARREEQLQEVVEAIEASGGQAFAYVADLSKIEDCDELVEKVLKDHGRLDVLVNNAARSIRRPIAESIERFHDFERVMQLNFYAPLRLIRGFLPGMRERKEGYIVNVLTAGVTVPSVRFGAYGASKAALSHMTDTLGAELLDEGVYCSGIFLPWVRTPMMDTTGHYKDTEAMTPDQAAEWILDAVTHKRPHAMDNETRRRWVVNALAPRSLSRIMSVLKRIYHDDEDAYPEFAMDRALLKRFVKGKLL